MANWRGSLIFRRWMSKTKSSVGMTNHTNVWENSQGLIGDYANKPINLVTLDYLLTLQKGEPNHIDGSLKKMFKFVLCMLIENFRFVWPGECEVCKLTWWSSDWTTSLYCRSKSIYPKSVWVVSRFFLYFDPIGRTQDKGTTGKVYARLGWTYRVTSECDPKFGKRIQGMWKIHDSWEQTRLFG